MKQNPGSTQAIEQGCKCPVIDNAYGKGAYIDKDNNPIFWYSDACEIHDIPEDHAYFNEGDCTCDHDEEDHGWTECNVEGCGCIANWEY